MGQGGGAEDAKGQAAVKLLFFLYLFHLASCDVVVAERWWMRRVWGE